MAGVVVVVMVVVAVAVVAERACGNAAAAEWSGAGVSHSRPTVILPPTLHLPVRPTEWMPA